ncbi:hypothetical protein K504DRAFT_122216 [Pleomassaria siparia CBS 279.74]|uniref:Homeobox domain-containing protein n=1 Tax=Pleomassaria siparia CBS 279.74 TaxID=1314801 RepID=A0A6G1KJW8_9PLEO|nr:hypothetical protein K504DRAFT_122216 [Pleomassaria siparia CBS 279.74]
MLFLHGSKDASKRVAPSIWSLDSGYQSSSLVSNKSLEELALAQPFTSQALLSNGYLQSPIEEDTAFPTKAYFNSDYFLPELEREGEACLQCEFWRITNPDEDIKCENCRIPAIVEPVLAVFASTGSSVGQDSDFPPWKSEGSKEKVLNTLDCATRCSACELSALIDTSAPSPCQSCARHSELLSPISPASPEYKIRPSRAGRNPKLPLRALNQLQAWLDANQDDPYPSAEVKRQLAQECGITEKQINTWMTNARARKLNPLDTWLSSGSDNDAAHESDIASAAHTPVYTTGFSYIPDNYLSVRGKNPGSVSGSSAFSAGNVRPQPSRRGKKKNYRRTNQTPSTSKLNSPTLTTSPISPARNNAQTDQEMWQCTFCKRSLVPKSWRRHEETQHRPKAEWTCMLHGPSLSFPSRINSQPHSHSNAPSSCCAFCMHKNPSEDHFSKHHRISECAKRPINERTFYRPDHLRQHIKNFHGATLHNIVQGRWKRDADVDEKRYTCGFCGVWLENWNRREAHIAGHFKEGVTMEDWTDPETWQQQKRNKHPSVHTSMSMDMDIDMDIDMAIDTDAVEEKDKKQHIKGKTEKQEKHISGFARLSRTLTRRSTRRFDTPEQTQTQTQTLSQPTSSSSSSSVFVNTFAPHRALPAAAASTPMTYPPPNHIGYSAPPVLPDINIDPLINDDGYGNLINWSQMHTNDDDDNNIYNGDMGLGMSMDMSMDMDMSMAPDTTHFVNPNYVDAEFEGHGRDWERHGGSSAWPWFGSAGPW